MTLHGLQLIHDYVRVVKQIGLKSSAFQEVFLYEHFFFGFPWSDTSVINVGAKSMSSVSVLNDAAFLCQSCWVAVQVM